MSRPDCLICGEPVDPGKLEPIDPKNPKGAKRSGIIQRFVGFEPIAYCPKHAHRVDDRPKKRRSGFRLTGVERLAVLRGEHPRLERSHDALRAVEGQVVHISELVEIVIGKPGTNKRGEVLYPYVTRDQRLDRPRLMRWTPPALRPEIARHDRVHPPTPAEIDRAAEESAYASSGGQETVIADGGEAPSRSYEAEQGLRARLRSAERIRDEIVGT